VAANAKLRDQRKDDANRPSDLPLPLSTLIAWLCFLAMCSIAVILAVFYRQARVQIGLLNAYIKSTRSSKMMGEKVLPKRRGMTPEVLEKQLDDYAIAHRALMRETKAVTTNGVPTLDQLLALKKQQTEAAQRDQEQEEIAIAKKIGAPWEGKDAKGIRATLHSFAAQYAALVVKLHMMRRGLKIKIATDPNKLPSPSEILKALQEQCATLCAELTGLKEQRSLFESFLFQLFGETVAHLKIDQTRYTKDGVLDVSALMTAIATDLKEERLKALGNTLNGLGSRDDDVIMPSLPRMPTIPIVSGTYPASGATERPKSVRPSTPTPTVELVRRSMRAAKGLVVRGAFPIDTLEVLDCCAVFASHALDLSRLMPWQELPEEIRNLIPEPEVRDAPRIMRVLERCSSVAVPLASANGG
jgi:hypothetical protein